jgi:MFS family permease
MAPSSTSSLDRRGWGALLVLCGALFLDGLDVSMLGVALPSIDADLHLSTASLQWVVSGYVLGYGGLLLLGGRAADLLGRRRVFLIALVVFAAASLLGGVVSDANLLIATRFIKGVSAAFTAPAGLSIITTTFAEGPARNRALAVYSGTGASGFSLGLVFGGVLTLLGWRWTFLIPAPIALALVFFGRGLIAPDPARERVPLRSYDLPGAVAIAAGMLLLVLSVVRAPQVGWTDPATLIGFASSIVLLASFVAIEMRTATPLVRLSIFRTPGIVRANVAAAVMFGCYVSFQFIATLYLQDGLGWSSLGMALGLLPGGLVVAFGAPRVGLLIGRLGIPRIIALGMLLFAIGYVLFIRIGTDMTYVTVLLPTMLLIGLGFALVFPGVNIAATMGVPHHEQGLASGLVQSSLQVGGALVLAVTTALVTSATTSSHAAAGSKQALLDGYHSGLWLVGAVAVAGFLIAISGLAPRRRAPAVDMETA